MIQIKIRKNNYFPHYTINDEQCNEEHKTLILQYKYNFQPKMLNRDLS